MIPRPDPTRAPRLERAPSTLWRAGEFGVVLLAPRAAAPVTLGGTGRGLWDALAEPRTREQLASDLAAAYDADPQVVADDIEPVVEQLLSIGAIEWCS